MLSNGPLSRSSSMLKKLFQQPARAYIGTAIVVIALAVSACDQEKMVNQPRYEALEAAGESDYFAGIGSARKPPEGTVPRDANLGPPPKPEITLALLRRGQEHYNVFCAPCHGRAGYGKGVIVRHGFPPPPSYHIPRLRAAPDEYFYGVITDGYGVMYSYANRVKPEDRWAIVAYIRALQLSQHAKLNELPVSLREELP